MAALLSSSAWSLPSWTSPIIRPTFVTPQLTTGVFSRVNGFESEVKWNACGERLQCASISAPLDHQNPNDNRTIEIAVTRVQATNQTHRKGAIFVNPGGPGISGTRFISATGTLFADFLEGQYDIVGFDPRGVNQTKPYVSCFDSMLQQAAFFKAYSLSLNLPASPSVLDKSVSVKEDLSRQIALYNASITSLAQECYKRTGDAIGYVGTEAVARDINFMTQKIYGEDALVNYWGLSYGTIIGQYLVKVLPGKRIGKVIIDGVSNATLWNQYPTGSLQQGLQDTDKVFDTFASTCIKAGQKCALNAVQTFKNSAALTSKVDSTIDSLYFNPVPGYNLGEPLIANAVLVRRLIFGSTYFSIRWPLLASVLAEVMQGNVTTLLSLQTQPIVGALANLPDSSAFAPNAIFCADTKPYGAEHPAPTLSQLTDLVLTSLRTYSRRSADLAWSVSLCSAWDKAGLYPRRTYHNGTFELSDGTLSTPALILTNTLDNITPLASAQLAAKHFGSNGRLVQQSDGVGHTSFSLASFCTGQIVHSYFVNGVVPSKSVTLCKVNQHPFVPFNATSTSNLVDQAWGQLALSVQENLL